jgi:hypothetical protein
VYVNGVGVATTPTGIPRPDVAAAVGFAGPGAGFQVDVPMDIGATVCVYAINVGGGTVNTPLGCKTVDGRDHADPVGAWDVTTARPGAVRLAGWTADPDRAYDPDAAIGDVRVSMDGVDWGDLHTGAARTDVAAAVPWAGPKAGFDQTIVALPGTHQICLFSLNLGTRGIQNLTLGCRTVSVAGVTPAGVGDPRGSLDGFHAQWIATFFTVLDASGWAWDPCSLTCSQPGPPPDSAEVTVRWSTVSPIEPNGGGNLYGGTVDLGEDSAPTTIPRPDVRAVFPSAPVNTGWKMVIRGNFHGPVLIRAVCAYAHTIDPNHVLQHRDERLIGCAGNPTQPFSPPIQVGS